MGDDMRKEVLGEVLMGELKAIREYVQEIPAIKKSVYRLEVDMTEVKTDIKAIKAVIKDHSSQMDSHETDIRYLKHKVA